jgi:hypothetical protein
MVLLVPPSKRPGHKFNLRKIDPTLVLLNLLPVIQALQDPKFYDRAYSQPVGRKQLQRAMLWEPLLDLLVQFGVENFNAHRPLIATIRSLHLACGIDPPDGIAVRQTVSAWKRR